MKYRLLRWLSPAIVLWGGFLIFFIFASYGSDYLKLSPSMEEEWLRDPVRREVALGSRRRHFIGHCGTIAGVAISVVGLGMYVIRWTMLARNKRHNDALRQDNGPGDNGLAGSL